jgi:hypothetical protein
MQAEKSISALTNPDQKNLCFADVMKYVDKFYWCFGQG